ncbi:MAG: hypothetical protein K6E62_05000 [Lachnospiraceae bacterium]|nr:hypothetical protein [Lachnospiraceae bacterium]
MKEVYWHLPGFCSFYPVHQTLLHMMKDEHYRFREGYRIGSVYGTFPGAIWNGGRAVFGMMSQKDMKTVIDSYNSFGVPVRFTWTNPLIEEKHLNDTYCNLIMQLASGKDAAGNMTAVKVKASSNIGIADDGHVDNQVLVNSAVLEEYLRKNYPDFGYLSSTTKRIKGLDGIREELAKDYRLVVLDYDLNHNEEVLKALEPDAGRIEILVDEICYPECPKRKEHYADEGLRQLTFDKDTPFPCPNRKTAPSFDEASKRPAFIGNDTIGEYIDRGYVNFKLVGRGLPVQILIDSYVYYLAKEEEREYVRRKLEAVYKRGR